MYTAVAGKLHYRHRDADHADDAEDVYPCIHVGDKICEAALWTTWTHVGTVLADTAAQTLLLSSHTNSSLYFH